METPASAVGNGGPGAATGEETGKLPNRVASLPALRGPGAKLAALTTERVAPDWAPAGRAASQRTNRVPRRQALDVFPELHQIPSQIRHGALQQGRFRRSQRNSIAEAKDGVKGRSGVAGIAGDLVFIRLLIQSDPGECQARFDLGDQKFVAAPREIRRVHFCRDYSARPSRQSVRFRTQRKQWLPKRPAEGERRNR